MAKNWTVGEAYEALKNGDKSAIADFGKRFPLATWALTKASNVEDFVSGIPEHITMRKIDANLKDGVEAFEEDDEDIMNKPEKKTRKAGKTDEEKKAAAKARREARKAKKAAEVEEDEDEEADEVEEEATEDYSKMNAVELFKLCKKRGITAQPKQKASVYIKLLKAADEPAEDAEDDWEDEEEAPAPKKSKGRPKKEAAPKKAAKKEEPEDDDEDDWDI